MEEDGMLSPPLWLQTSDTLGRANRRRHLRRSYSLLLNSSALIVVFSVVALSFIFIVLPTLNSFISHIFKPQLVKKGWDLLNVALVLFAIICGFLGRNYNESTSSDNNPSTSNASQSRETIGSNQSTPHSWYEYSDRTPYNRINRLRSSSSYPDLRQESPWIDNDEGWKYYDDTHISSYRTFVLNHHQHLYQRQPREEGNVEEIGAKNVEADTDIASTKESSSATPQPLPSPPPPPSSPPLPSAQSTPSAPTLSSPPRCSSPKLTKRTYQAIGKNEESEVQERAEWEVKNFLPPPSTLPPPPLLEPTILFGHGNEISGQNGKKRATATKDFLSTLRRRRKKQRQRSIENFEALSRSQSSSLAEETSQKHRTPPPPPPPPPPSVFHSLFTTKKGKQKKVQPTPPPTLSPRKPRKLPTRKEKTKSYTEASTTYAPSLPMKVSDVTRVEESVNKGNESPLISIPPPPPPPPPFKVRKWKFAVQGDFIRINSMDSSRSSSPDLDDGGDSPSNGKIQMNEMTAVQGRETPLFCPSPDVDLKANRFIARFRAGLKLEKVNSMNEKQSRGKSNLGQSQIHFPEEQAMQPS